MSLTTFLVTPIRELILFSIITIGLYFPTIQYGYILDDSIVVSENKFVQKGIKGIWDILSKESFTGYFGEQMNLVAGSRYRPLSLVSFAIEHQFFGQNPHISHGINIILYILCGWFLFRLSRKLFKPSPTSIWYWNISFVVAVLYLLHPIHSEAVANIKGRDEIMSFLFSFMAFEYFIDYLDQKNKRKLYAACICFTLALFSKENTVTFLAAIPFALVYFRSMSLMDSLKKCVPLIGLAIIFLFLRYQVIGYFLYSGIKITDLMNDPFIGMNIGQKWATITYTLGWYVTLLVWPHPLTHDYYPYHVPIVQLSDIKFLASVALLGLLLYLMWKLRKNNPIVSYSILFFFLSISIVSNIVFSVGTFMNERFLFVASVGYTWVLAHYMTKPHDRLRQLFKMGFLVVCGLYAYKTWTRIPDWSDPFRLNLAAVKVSKNSARINLFTGVSYFNAYQSDQNNDTRFENLKIAEKYIDQALTIFPKYGQGLNMKAGVLAEWYKKDNDLPKFLANIEPIIAQKPDLDFVNQYMIYLNKSPQNNAALLPFYIKTGYEILYRKLRRYDFALQYLGWAYTMDIKNAELLFKMATIYDDYAKFGKLNTKEREVQMENARQFYLQAAQLDPKYARQ